MGAKWEPPDVFNGTEPRPAAPDSPVSPVAILFPQLGALTRLRSRRRGHRFDPCIAHSVFYQVNGSSTINVDEPLIVAGSKWGADDLDHLRICESGHDAVLPACSQRAWGPAGMGWVTWEQTPMTPRNL
ncbi:hypothetical protein GCM10009634_48540 [Saccharothrix xinjiangensis]